MTEDVPDRRFRYIEVLAPSELNRSRRGPPWRLVDGWLEAAEAMSPRTPKALLEGDTVIQFPDGVRLKEVSFKTEHESVGAALSAWAIAARRRWAKVVGDRVVRSDGVAVTRGQVREQRVE